jgi:hypothetical protein
MVRHGDERHHGRRRARDPQGPFGAALCTSTSTMHRHQYQQIALAPSTHSLSVSCNSWAGLSTLPPCTVSPVVHGFGRADGSSSLSANSSDPFPDHNHRLSYTETLRFTHSIPRRRYKGALLPIEWVNWGIGEEERRGWRSPRAPCAREAEARDGRMPGRVGSGVGRSS